MRERQRQIIEELGVKPVINPEEEIALRTQFLVAQLAHTGLKGFVLGISGGQDSLLAGLLTQRAVKAYRQSGGNATFHAVLLPYGTQSDRDDALLAVKTIGPDQVHDFDIKPTTDAFAATFQSSTGDLLLDYHKGNVKARTRMMAQYAIGGQHNLLVVGTDHASEAVTGFFTKYGDGGADILPLSGLTKFQGRDMLTVLGTPAIFTQKAPTADLLDARPGQTDESELGLDYHTLENYLTGKDIDVADAEKIETRFDTTAHKRTVPLAYRRK